MTTFRDHLHMVKIKTDYANYNYLNVLNASLPHYKDLMSDKSGAKMIFEALMKGLDDKSRAIVRECLKESFNHDDFKKYPWLERIQGIWLGNSYLKGVVELREFRTKVANRFASIDWMTKSLEDRYFLTKRKVYDTIIAHNLNASERDIDATKYWANLSRNDEGKFYFRLGGHGVTFKTKPLPKNWLKTVGEEGIATALHGESKVFVHSAKFLHAREENITVFRASWYRKVGTADKRTWVLENGFVGRFGTKEQSFAVKTAKHESRIIYATRTKAMRNILENVADRQAS